MRFNKKYITLLSLCMAFILMVGIFYSALLKPQENIVFADVNSTDSTNSLGLSVKSYYLMDYNTEKKLCGYNENERLEVASMVKLMTTLLAMEKIEKGEWNLDTKLHTSEYAASMEGSQAFLDAGYDYKLDDLLKSIIMASANDSCVVIAENMSRSEQNFVNLMNKRAEELGMTNTLYGNCTGLPAISEYSCAKDIALILSKVYEHDIYHKYSTIWMDKLIYESGRETELVNTNRLVRYYPGCDCGKTGFTDEEGYCLSASASKNNMRLVSVVMGAKTSADRFENSTKLLNYGFSNFENKKVVEGQKLIDELVKVKGVRENIEIASSKDMFLLSKRGDNTIDYEIKTQIDKNVKAPLKSGDKIGTIYVIENGVVQSECDLVCLKDYNKLSYWDAVRQAIDNYRLFKKA